MLNVASSWFYPYDSGSHRVLKMADICCPQRVNHFYTADNKSIYDFTLCFDSDAQ